jgi:hypothetical protein
MSRNFTDLTEWKLKSEIFHRICNHFFQPDIDLFASRLNCQLPKYVLELRSENQFWAGQNGTIKIAFSTLSLMIFSVTFPIKLNGGKI